MALAQSDLKDVNDVWVRVNSVDSFGLYQNVHPAGFNTIRANKAQCLVYRYKGGDLHIFLFYLHTHSTSY